MNLHGPVRAPHDAEVGDATLNVELVGWPEGKVAPVKITAEVAAPKTTFKTEPISERLIRSLPHPDRRSSIPLVRFAPDRRLIVSGYPSGLVQILDPVSYKELHTIETPPGLRGSLNHIQVSKDLSTLFVALDDSTFEPITVKDTKTYFRRYRGETRVYDLNTGEQKPSLKTEPRRGVMSLAISPDASRIATMEYTSGRSEDFDKLRAIYLWEVNSGKSTKLRDGYGDLRFSPDGQTVFVTVNNEAAKTGVMYAYSATTGEEVGKLESKDGSLPGLSFSPDGTQAAAGTIDPQSKKPIIRLYDPATIKPKAELAASNLPDDHRFSHVVFSPDGKKLAAMAKSTLHLWELESRKLVNSWPFETPCRVWHLTFDPESRRLAALSLYIPPELEGVRDEVTTPQDFPQPKVFLIDVSANKLETIVCPHGWWGRPAFSADGKLLAVGGAGATHVFDVGR